MFLNEMGVQVQTQQGHCTLRVWFVARVCVQ